MDGGAEALTRWLQADWRLDPQAAAVLVALFEAQEQASEIPRASELLVEESPYVDGFAYTFHAPLSRATCEALSRRDDRATGSTAGQRPQPQRGRPRVVDPASRATPGSPPTTSPPFSTQPSFMDDVIQGLDRGELLAGRFRHVAATAMMVLRNPDGGRTRVGGMSWVSRRLFPLVKAACPDHPLLREARREVLEDFLDAPTALTWLQASPPSSSASWKEPLPLPSPGSTLRAPRKCGSSPLRQRSSDFTLDYHGGQPHMSQCATDGSARSSCFIVLSVVISLPGARRLAARSRRRGRASGHEAPP